MGGAIFNKWDRGAAIDPAQNGSPPESLAGSMPKSAGSSDRRIAYEYAIGSEMSIPTGNDGETDESILGPRVSYRYAHVASALPGMNS